MDTLTRWEWRALEGGFNLADGHARQREFGHEDELISALPSIYEESYLIPHAQAEKHFWDEFWSIFFREHIPVQKNFLLHYSSSVSTDVVAKFCRLTQKKVFLVSPTFDNIPALLVRNGVVVLPIKEKMLYDKNIPVDSALNACAPHDAVFLVNPNNPTGTELSEERLIDIAEYCSTHQLCMIVDNTFRVFRARADLDDLRLVLTAKCSFVFIEDTGKMFSSNDLKVGFIVCSDDCYRALREISEDILLNVSPFVLRLFVKTSQSFSDSRLIEAIHALTARNRLILKEAIEGLPLNLVEVSCPISVALLELPASWNAQSVAHWFGERGLGVLPGDQFFWDSPETGSRYIRIALMRSEQYFRQAINILRALVTSYADSTGKSDG